MTDPGTEQKSNEAFEGAFEEAIELREAGAFDAEAFRRQHPEHADRVLELLDVADAVAPPDAKASDAAPPRGNRIGHYRLVELLGQGGQGQVYLAEDTRLKRRVALKLLTAGLTASGRARLRFAREAEAASKLQHPGICTIYEVGEDDGIPFIAMAFVTGKPLREAIDTARMKASIGSSAAQVDLDAGTPVDPAVEPRGEERGPLERHQIVRIVTLVEQAARALHVAHEKGLVHRDIKPGNIMVSEDGLPVLLDFGLARDLEAEDPTLTATGDVMGTPAYLSPEQIAARRVKIDRRTDIFSLGVVLFECLTLRRPFDAPTREGLYRAILTQEPPDPRSLNPSLPRDLVAVLQTVLEKEPDRRYQTAEKLADDLAAVREGRPVSVKPISAVGRAIRWARRKPAVAAVVALLAVGIPAVAGLGGFLAANWDRMRLGAETEHRREVEHLLNEGYLQFGEGSMEKARDAFERLFALDPDPGPEAVWGFAKSWQQLGELPRVIALLEGSPHLARSSIRGVLEDALLRTGREQEAKALAARRDSAPRDAIDCFVLGMCALDEGHAGNQAAFPRALALLREAVLRSDHPPPNYYFQLAHVAHHLRDEAFSRQIADVITRRWPESPFAWCWAAGAVGWFDFERAEAWSRKSANLYPDNALNLSALGLALRGLGRLDEAIVAFREAVRLAPDHPVHRANLMAALHDAGHLDEALVAAKEMMRVNSDDAQSQYNVAGLMQSLGKADEALRHAREAVRLAPYRVQYHLGLVAALRAAGHLDEALVAAKEMIRVKSDYAPGQHELAALMRNLGKAGEAARHAREAVRLDPDRIEYHCELVTSLLTASQLDEARVAAKEMMRVKSDYALSQYNMALLMRNLGKADEAARHAIEALRLSSSNELSAFGCAVLGETLANCGHPREASEAYRRAIALDPKDAESHNNLGLIHLSERRLSEAVRCFQRARKANPQLVQPLINLGEVFRKEGRADEAVQYLREAVKVAPRSGDVHAALGLALAAAGRSLEALQEVREGYRLGRGQSKERAQAAVIRIEKRTLREVCNAVRSSNPDEIARAGETLRAVVAGWRIGEDELDRPARVRRLLRSLCGDAALSRLRDSNPDLTEEQNAAWRETWALVDRRRKEAGD